MMFMLRAPARWFRVLLPVMAMATLQLVVLLSIGATPVGAQPAPQDLMETIRADERFSSLVRAVEAAGLTDTLKTTGPYTFFAPTNDAFNKLAPGTLDALLKDPEMLRHVLASHLSSQVVTAAQAVQIPSLPDINGDPIRVNASGTSVQMNGSRVTQQDLRASNGVIHVVDTVWTATTLNPRALPTAGDADSRANTDALMFAAIGAFLMFGGVLATRRHHRLA
jgi:uncharacterized surface protein with fasciclin (FAS1) repeats